MKDLPAGHIITEEDIRRKRLEIGLAPKYFDALIGRKLRVAVIRGQATSWDGFV